MQAGHETKVKVMRGPLPSGKWMSLLTCSHKPQTTNPLPLTKYFPRELKMFKMVNASTMAHQLPKKCQLLPQSLPNLPYNFPSLRTRNLYTK